MLLSIFRIFMEFDNELLNFVRKHWKKLIMFTEYFDFNSSQEFRKKTKTSVTYPVKVGFLIRNQRSRNLFSEFHFTVKETPQKWNFGVKESEGRADDIADETNKRK